MYLRSSVRKRPGRPADSRQAFSPVRLGQSKTCFSGQALEKAAGFVSLAAPVGFRYIPYDRSLFC